MNQNLKQLEEYKAQLDTLKKSFSSIEKGFRELVKPKTEIKADGMKDMGPTTQDCMNYIDSQSKYFWQAISNLQQSIYSTQDSFYSTFASHLNNHVPKLTPSQMQEFLKSCGAENDYVIQKPVLNITASKTSRGKQINISFQKEVS